MARYRKIDVRMWSDREVRRLSRPEPNGQSLWVYLLTGRETAIIPGVFAARESGLAEELGWSLEGFRKAFQEVSGEAFAKGLPHGAEKALAHADWDAGLVWVPNGIKHNAPQSPNVITHWSDTWDELPECDLKEQAYWGLRAFVEGKGEGFQKAFQKAIPKPSWKPLPKPLPIQEQEQEQEQDVVVVGSAQLEELAPVAPRLASNSSLVDSRSVARAWHQAIELSRVAVGISHAHDMHLAEFEAIAGAVNGAVQVAAERPAAVVALCRWFWCAPQGPIQAGRLKPYSAFPKHLAKRVSQDIHSASDWWLSQQQRLSAQEAAP